MGCASSSPDIKDAATKQEPKLSFSDIQIKNNPLSVEEIQSRIEAPKESHSLTLAGITFKYAWVSQRGYYPEGFIVHFINLLSIIYQLRIKIIKIHT